MKGRFIVLEGGEGSGKSSCIQYLRERLSNRDDVVFTREPGGTPFGLKLRELLLHSSEERSARAEMLVFCADRANHINEIIYPSLMNGKNVICDRFDYSTFAYQVFGRARFGLVDEFKRANGVAKAIGHHYELQPDMVIFLDVDPETGLKRVNDRSDENTVFDNETLAFHQRVREGYRKQIDSRWLIVDANKSKEDVLEKVWQAVNIIIYNKKEEE